LAIIGIPCFSANDLLAMKDRAQPSVIYEAVPAVTVPSFLKGVLSLAIPSTVDSLIPSSSSIVT